MKIPWIAVSTQLFILLITTIGVVLLIFGISVTGFRIYWIFFLGIGFILGAQLLRFLTEKLS